LLLLLAALMSAPSSPAVEELVLHVGRVDAGEWSAGGVSLRLGFAGDDRLSVQLSASALALPDPLHRLRTVSFECPEATMRSDAVECAGAELVIGGDGGRAQPLPLSMRFDWKAERWRLEAKGAQLSPGALWAFASEHGLVPALEVADGEGSLTLALDGDAAGQAARLEAAVSGLDFSDSQGLHAGEDLNVRLEVRVSRAKSAWRTRAALQVDAGQLYLDPVFVDAGAAPIAVSAAGNIDPESGRVHLSPFRFHHASVGVLEGEVSVAANGAVEALDLRLGRTAAAPLYATYVQPFAIGTLLDAVAIDGEVAARLEWQARPERQRLQIDLDGLGVDDAAGRFSLLGVRGHVDWSNGAASEATTLSWDGGRFYRIDFGAGVLGGRFAGRRFDLDAPVQVPLLEGGVQVSDLRVDGIGTRDLSWQFRGSVQPMSLTALTSALDWPTFGGTLGGDIPLVSYRGGVITVDGSLDLEVFEGKVRIRQLRIANPFGVIPVLYGDVDLQNLSLDALTGTFSFGNIQGRLQGRVHGLILKDWKPTRFEARFATPEDDDSRHRISQRAVENLASLGGAGAVLSSTFLRIFDEFSYRRLGIACRLENGVCDMDGVAPAQRGYYIVEGGGLPPRIDVLGFNRRVDWEVLLGRLRQVVSTEGPVIR
jgi:hypothetical protein